MLGYAIVAAGAFVLWVAAAGKAPAFLRALKVQLPSAGSGNSIVPTPGSPGELTSGGGVTVDSGAHQGLLPDGTVVTIQKSYAQMSDTEKDAANNFAHMMGG